MNEINKIAALLSQGIAETDLYEQGYKLADIRAAQEQIKQELSEREEKVTVKALQKEELSPEKVIRLVEESLDRLERKAVDMETPIDIQVERQLQGTASLLWKMMQDSGYVTPVKDTHFTIEIVDSVELQKENENG